MYYIMVADKKDMDILLDALVEWSVTDDSRREQVKLLFMRIFSQDRLRQAQYLKKVSNGHVPT